MTPRYHPWYVNLAAALVWVFLLLTVVPAALIIGGLLALWTIAEERINRGKSDA